MRLVLIVVLFFSQILILKIIMGQNRYSKVVTQDPSQPAAQAMLHAIGLTDDDFQKHLVGIATTGYEGNPCTLHLNDLAAEIKKGSKE